MMMTMMKLTLSRVHISQVEELQAVKPVMLAWRAVVTDVQVR